MRLLIVEDEPRLAAALKQLCEEHQYAVDHASDGMTGLDLAMTGSYDAIILDIMLPKMTGLEVLRHLRKQKMTTPVLLLTAMDTVDDRVRGLDVGADDYMVKPFANEELLARVRALTRRSASLTASDEVLTAGPFNLNLTEHVVMQDSEPLTLTVKEYQLLELLLRNQGKVLSKEVILDRVWGPDADVIGNAVENYIHFLRKKIDKEGYQSFIETVRGVGYVFRSEPSQKGRG